MSGQPKRRWFQIHLSTAVVVMFVAGGLLWANLTERVYTRYDHIVLSYEWGWPANIQRTESYVVGDESIVKWKRRGFAIDISVALFVLVAIGGVSEYLIRRRKPPA